MTNSLEDEVRKFLATMDEEENEQEQETGISDQDPGTLTPQQEEVYDVYTIPGKKGFVIVEAGEEPPDLNVVEATFVSQKTKKIEPIDPLMYGTGLFFVSLVLSCLALQIFLIMNPPIATVTIFPKGRTVTLSGTLQLGRLLSPITLSQSAITKTTGKGHQDARSARGTITFYNGSFTGQTLPAGTVLTGADGVQMTIDQDAYLPPESQTIPPTLGQITVSAHALVPGTKGNIPAGDINQGCCAPSILAQNTAPFYNGQDERNYQTVARNDIYSVAIPLETTLSESMHGALTAQITQNEQLQILPCTPRVISDHQPGDEAPLVKLTVSMVCSGIAYNTANLQNQAIQLLTAQAGKKLGIGYTLFGNVQVSVKAATTQTTADNTVVLSFTAQGTWVYALNAQEQQHIKLLIAGKTKQEAFQLLASMPGIEKVSLRWDENTKLPKDNHNIQILVIFTA
jgi:hypothetical protein